MPEVEVLLRMQGIRGKTERHFCRDGITDGTDVPLQENVIFNTKKPSAPFRDPAQHKVLGAFVSARIEKSMLLHQKFGVASRATLCSG